MIVSGQAILIIIAIVGTLLLCHNVMFTVEGAGFTEVFDPRFRTSGISLGYQASSIIQGFVPLVAAALNGTFAGSALQPCLPSSVLSQQSVSCSRLKRWT